MKRNSQPSAVLHILLHLAERNEPVTSGQLSRMLETNPVVVRRIMAGLRDEGYVRSEKGHGGGWTLTYPLSNLTLRDIHTALGRSELFAIGNRTESPGCVVEQAVNAALARTFDEVEALLLTRFAEVTLESLYADAQKRRAARGSNHQKVRANAS